MASKSIVTISYDVHEKDSGVPEFIDKLATSKTIHIRGVHESLVDYVILCGGKSDSIGIERKEMNDFANSIKAGKIPSQIKRIIDYGFTPVFLVEGLFPDHHSSMNLKSVYGYMDWLSASGIVISHTVDAEHTAQRIIKMAEDLRDGKFGVLKVPVVKTEADHPTIKRLMAIPGIADGMAVRIRNVFTDEAEFFSICVMHKRMGSSVLTDIKGIGDKLAGQIADEVTKRWN